MSKSKNAPDIHPPSHLSQRAKSLWRKLVPIPIKELGRQTLLQVTLESLDQADECRRCIAKDGLTHTTTRSGAIHVHPLAKLEKESRQTFMRGWAQLGLTDIRNNRGFTWEEEQELPGAMDDEDDDKAEEQGDE